MLNIELKKKLIEDGTSDWYRKRRSEMVAENKIAVCERAKYDPDVAREIFDMDFDEVIECERIRNNAMRQRNKIEDHLAFLMKGNWTLLFLTLTFSDDCLATTTPATRRTTIRRLLADFCDDYILNIDYGRENEREHYHAIVAVLDGCAQMTKDDAGHLLVDRLEKGYRYGFYSAEKISTDIADSARLSRYITKLTMHSIKVRQSKVSVKQGSPYQRFKALKEERKLQARTPDHRLFAPDYETEEVWLLSGFAG